MNVLWLLFLSEFTAWLRSGLEMGITGNIQRHPALRLVFHPGLLVPPPEVAIRLSSLRKLGVKLNPMSMNGTTASPSSMPSLLNQQLEGLVYAINVEIEFNLPSVYTQALAWWCNGNTSSQLALGYKQSEEVPCSNQGQAISFVSHFRSAPSFSSLAPLFLKLKLNTTTRMIRLPRRSKLGRRYYLHMVTADEIQRCNPLDDKGNIKKINSEDTQIQKGPFEVEAMTPFRMWDRDFLALSQRVCAGVSVLG
ncbi:hypothetical protein DFH06DRAFT_1144610 [Mycena polygramma]|nr:hypothetical protein DFH06DRAFT_1144610 [Mycena polygramma]